MYFLRWSRLKSKRRNRLDVNCDLRIVLSKTCPGFKAIIDSKIKITTDITPKHFSFVQFVSIICIDDFFKQNFTRYK